MTYKGYEGVLEVDEEAGELVGIVKGLFDVITFVGKTVEEARESFEKSVDFYLERCAATGKKPDRPYSGKLLACVSPETHRGLERIADRRKVNLDEIASEVLASFVRWDMSMDSAAEWKHAGFVEAADRATGRAVKPEANREAPTFRNPGGGPEEPAAPARRRGKRA